jgi:hypothetical protein
VLVVQADHLPEPQDVFTYMRVRGLPHVLLCGGTAAPRHIRVDPTHLLEGATLVQSQIRLAYYPAAACHSITTMVGASSKQTCILRQDKDIGQDQALYYTAYATFLEMRGGHARAREVYREGLARCANLHCHVNWIAGVVTCAGSVTTSVDRPVRCG